MEDLLPFSDERLVRAVAAVRTPVVSAIGHEADAPLLDLVADLRSRTPTHAAKDTVPDVGEEHERVRALRERAWRVINGLLEREERGLA
ncbi:exodeoxyribonuclease VII large subunit, partial [Streptomyces nanshensis]